MLLTRTRRRSHSGLSTRVHGLSFSLSRLYSAERQDTSIWSLLETVGVPFTLPRDDTDDTDTDDRHCAATYHRNPTQDSSW